MLYYRYRLSDGVFLNALPTPPTYDPETEGVHAYPVESRPNLRLHRFDAEAKTKMRLATSEELAAKDAVDRDAESLARLSADKLLESIVAWVADSMRIPREQARQEILALYRSL